MAFVKTCIIKSRRSRGFVKIFKLWPIGNKKFIKIWKL